MLLHGHAVGNGQRQRAARPAFAQQHGDHRHLQAGHGNQVVGDGVALSTLLGLGAAESALRVHQAHDRTAELLSLAHKAQRLTIPLGLRATEIARDALLEVGALFLADNGDGAAADPADAADDGAVVGEAAIAVQFDEPIDHCVDIRN